QLCNARHRDHRVVTENTTEVVLVGENLVLQRQEDAGAVDQVNHWQAILQPDALGPEDLLAGKGKEGPGLDCGVVGDDHETAPGDAADAGDDAGRGCPAPFLIHAPGRPQPELQEGYLGIEQLRDALAGREAALSVLAGNCLGAASFHQDLLLLAEFFDALPHSP